MLQFADRYAAESGSEQDASSPIAAESPEEHEHVQDACKAEVPATVPSAQSSLGPLYTAAQTFESIFAQAWPGSFATHVVVRELGISLTDAHTLLAVLEVLEVRSLVLWLRHQSMC